MNHASHRAFKDRLFQQLARVSKALANPHRLELVDLLAQGERTVEDLARLTDMPVANTSQHLKALREALLVTVRRDGSFSWYRLSDDQVLRVWQAIRVLGQAQFAEIDRLLKEFVSERETFESVSSAELLERMRRGDVVVLDVRPAEEYRAGHIAGARSVPIHELGRRLGRISKNREIVAYCRGPFCVYADEAVAKLRRRGYRARRLDVGLPDWRVAGLPTEK
jgi:rhodanese-related sulfurtransferase